MTTVISMMKMRTGPRPDRAEIRRRYQLHAGVDAREQGQQALLAWFNEGDTRAYKIRFPNGTVDVFRGWVSSIGKAVTAKEVITRTVKVTNVGKPSVAEERSKITPVSAIKVTPTSGTVAKGKQPP